MAKRKQGENSQEKYKIKQRHLTLSRPSYTKAKASYSQTRASYSQKMSSYNHARASYSHAKPSYIVQGHLTIKQYPLTLVQRLLIFIKRESEGVSINYLLRNSFSTMADSLGISSIGIWPAPGKLISLLSGKSL